MIKQLNISRKVFLIIGLTFSAILLAQNGTLKHVNLLLSTLYSKGEITQGIDLGEKEYQKYVRNPSLYQDQQLQASYLHGNLGSLYVSAKDYGKAEQLYLAAIKVANESNDEKKLFAVANFHERMAVLCGIMDRYRDKVTHFRTARKIRKSLASQS